MPPLGMYLREKLSERAATRGGSPLARRAAADLHDGIEPDEGLRIGSQRCGVSPDDATAASAKIDFTASPDAAGEFRHDPPTRNDIGQPIISTFTRARDDQFPQSKK